MFRAHIRTSKLSAKVFGLSEVVEPEFYSIDMAYPGACCLNRIRSRIDRYFVFEMRIFFKESSCRISEEDLYFLNSIAKNLRLHEQFRITVIGRLSKKDSEDEIVSLSKKRVNTVIEALIDLGVPPAWIDCETWRDESSSTDSVQLFVFKP